MNTLWRPRGRYNAFLVDIGAYLLYNILSYKLGDVYPFAVPGNMVHINNIERLGKMTISLLHIIVPTILVLVVLILYINSSRKQVSKEIGELRTQLEQLDDVPELKTAAAAELIEDKAPAEEIAVQESSEKIEEQDDPADTITEAGASEYNTGKSGKIYTKEELESLIKE